MESADRQCSDRTAVIGIIAVLFPHLVNLNIGANTSTAAQSPLTAAATICAFIVIFGTLHWVLTRADVQSAYRKRVQQA
jgi:hypothetical protein